MTSPARHDRAALSRGIIACLALLAIALLACGCGPTIPQPLAAEVARTGPGKATIIEFIDFQCPFCRLNHDRLSSLLKERRGKVRLVRKQVPLRRHSHARSAALAAVCAEELGRGDEMADVLASADVEQLGAKGCEQMATELGLNVSLFRECVADPRSAARVQEEDELFDAVGGRGLPLLFIGAQRFSGLQDEATLERALDEEIAAAARASR